MRNGICGASALHPLKRRDASCSTGWDAGSSLYATPDGAAAVFNWRHFRVGHGPMPLKTKVSSLHGLVTVVARGTITREGISGRDSMSWRPASPSTARWSSVSAERPAEVFHGLRQAAVVA